MPIPMPPTTPPGPEPMPMPMPTPTPGEPTASGITAAALIAALQDPTVRQTIVSLLGAAAAPPAAPSTASDAAEWLVGVGAAFPVGAAR
jgi:hypothetical protein